MFKSFERGLKLCLKVEKDQTAFFVLRNESPEDCTLEIPPNYAMAMGIQ
jgi:hypothetical protein